MSRRCEETYFDVDVSCKREFIMCYVRISMFLSKMFNDFLCESDNRLVFELIESS